MEEKIIYNIEYNGVDELKSELKSLRTENQKLVRENESVNKSMLDGKQITTETAKAYAENEAQIKKNNAQIKQLTTEVQKTGKQQQNLSQRLKETQKQMETLALAGDTNSKQYVKLRNEAAQYRDTLDRVNNEIKVFADDQVAFKTALDGAQLLGAGMQGLVATQQLLGVENEKVVEGIAKLQQVMAITNSIQQVSNLLQKESRIIILAKVGATKVATAMQWAWNAAMTANPIGAIIMGVAALIAGIVMLIKHFDVVTEAIKKAWKWMQFWKKDTDEAADETERLAQETERLAEANEKLIKSLDRTSDKLQYEIKLLKAMGASKDDIIKKEEELIKVRLQQAVIQNSRIQRDAEATEEEKQAAADRVTALRQELVIFTEKINTERRLEAERAEEQRARRNTRLREEAAAREAEALERERVEEMAAARLLVMRDKNFENERALLELQKQRRLEDERLTNSERLIIEEEFLIAEAELRKHYDELENQDTRTAEEIAKEERLEAMKQEYEQYIEEEKSQFDQRLELYQEWLENKAISDEEYAALYKQLEEDKSHAALETAKAEHFAKLQLQKQELRAKMDFAFAVTDLMGVMAGNSKELFLFQQGLALGEAVGQLSLGLAKASASAAPPFNLIPIATFITQTAGILSNIRSVVAPKDPQIKKFARGGIISGPSHSAGGITFTSDRGHAFEMEGDEYLAIVNKRDAAYAAALSDINSRHGVDYGLSTNKRYFADGGTFKPQGDFERMNTNDIVRDVMEQIMSIPVTVLENDITGTQRRVEVLANNGNL